MNNIFQIIKYGIVGVISTLIHIIAAFLFVISSIVQVKHLKIVLRLIIIGTFQFFHLYRPPVVGNILLEGYRTSLLDGFGYAQSFKYNA